VSDKKENKKRKYQDGKHNYMRGMPEMHTIENQSKTPAYVFNKAMCGIPMLVALVAIVALLAQWRGAMATICI